MTVRFGLLNVSVVPPVKTNSPSANIRVVLIFAAQVVLPSSYLLTFHLPQSLPELVWFVRRFKAVTSADPYTPGWRVTVIPDVGQLVGAVGRMLVLELLFA